MLVSPQDPPRVASRFDAMVVWFNAEPLVPGRSYLIKHAVRTSRAKATSIEFRVDMNTLERNPTSELKMNDIGAVQFEAVRPLFFDPYERNRTTGSFILIDPLSNATVGAAMIRAELPAENARASDVEDARECGRTLPAARTRSSADFGGKKTATGAVPGASAVCAGL